MSYTVEHQQKFSELENQLRNRHELRRKANGGNSILFIYPPHEELHYLAKAVEVLGDKAAFIDISKLLVAFIDELGWPTVEQLYANFGNTPHKIFNSNSDPDLFNRIIAAIRNADGEGKLPVVIRTGCLVGTGIENVNIMEHKAVMELKHPLVIFYPATLPADDQLTFLNFKPASKYRCAVVK
jgi:hypothetical protein